MKILIIKIGAIGDVIMALPMLNEIKNKFPEAEITWVCGKTVHPILHNINIIDNLIVVDEKEMFKGGFLSKISQLFTIWTQLAFKKFDLELICHVDNRYKIFSLFNFSKERRKLNRRSGQRQIPISGRHHTFEYIRLFSNKELFEPVTVKYPEFKVDFYQKKIAKRIAIAPGGAKNFLNDDFLRRWDVNLYLELAKKLIQNGYEVLLIGSESDSWVSEYFKDLPVINDINKHNLLNTISILSSCQLIITHDSGPLHLSVLAKIPCIGIFGPTIPFEKIPLHSKKNHYFWSGSDLPCRPCYDGNTYSKLCKKNICMNETTPKMVLDYVLKMDNF